MTWQWVFAVAGLGLTFGATIGVAAMALFHGPACTKLQDTAYDKGWDTAVLVQAGVLRGNRWADSGRTSQLVTTGELYLSGAADWVSRHLEPSAYPPEAACGGHHCAQTDSGLICQTQLGGICPGAADARVAASAGGGRHRGGWHFTSPAALLAARGARH